MPTANECKSIIFKLAILHGVSPVLIINKLLSKDDKNDMLAGLIDARCLETAVKLWKEAGMPDWVNFTSNEIQPQGDEIDQGNMSVRGRKF